MRVVVTGILALVLAHAAVAEDCEQLSKRVTAFSVELDKTKVSIDKTGVEIEEVQTLLQDASQEEKPALRSQHNQLKASLMAAKKKHGELVHNIEKTGGKIRAECDI